MSSQKLLIFNGATLTVCAVFDFAWRANMLIGLMLFLPLLDKNWVFPKLRTTPLNLKNWGLVTTAILILLATNLSHILPAMNTMLLAALPEEWFFRAYFLQQLTKVKMSWVFLKHKQINQPFHPFLSNILTSTFFSLLHIPTQGWFALSIILPSLFYGWVYQKTQDLLLIILLHTLSNIIFFIYISQIGLGVSNAWQ